MEFGLRNIKNSRKALSEIYSVLKARGKTIVLELSKSRGFILKNMHKLYIGHILPIVGYLRTRDKKAYEYLRDSINVFMTPYELKGEFEIAGFQKTEIQNLTCGSECIHYGIK